MSKLAGNSVEVAGYSLSPALAAGLSAAGLATPPPVPVVWLEVGGEKLSPASQRVVDGWREQGREAVTGAVAGEPFWATQEIAEAPALAAMTAERLSA